jgi:hypothetical protein
VSGPARRSASAEARGLRTDKLVHSYGGEGGVMVVEPRDTSKHERVRLRDQIVLFIKLFLISGLVIGGLWTIDQVMLSGV